MDWPEQKRWEEGILALMIQEQKFDTTLHQAEVNFREKISYLLQQTQIDTNDILWYIDAVISFFQDILPYCDEILRSWNVTYNKELDYESIYLKEIFREIENRSWFQGKELKFMWSQINHIIQPFRNIRSSLDWARENPSLKSVLEWVIKHDVQKIKDHWESMIWKLENYKELCNSWDAQIWVWDFEQRFRKALWEEKIKYNIDISWNTGLWMHPITFQIMLDNLVSNYKKYWKNGQLFIFVKNSELQIIFKNDIKTKAEQGKVLSSEIGNNLLRDMVTELCEWKMEVNMNNKIWKYKISLSWMKLKKA